MNEKHIVSIDAVIDRIKIAGYIDCDEYSGDMEDYEYENIMYYLEKHKDLQSKIDKANELIKRKLSTETYQHLKKLYDDIDSTEEIWEDYEFEDLLDILKEDK